MGWKIGVYYYIMGGFGGKDLLSLYWKVDCSCKKEYEKLMYKLN